MNFYVVSFILVLFLQVSCNESNTSRFINCEYVKFIGETTECARISGLSLSEIDENSKIDCDDIPEKSRVCIFGNQNNSRTYPIEDKAVNPTVTTQASSTLAKLLTTKKVTMDLVNFLGIDAHNYHRKKHGVKPLEYSDVLAKHAQELAEYLATENVMKPRIQNIYGENIAESWKKSFDVGDATDLWYSEILNYNFQTGGRKWLTGEIEHFTQLVWADSKEIGIGIAESKTGRTYIVAKYYPRGNYVTSFTKNVFPKRPEF